MKIRTFPEKNYKAIYFNGKTIRIALDPSKPIQELDFPEFLDVKLTGKCFGKCEYCAHPDTLVKTEKGDVKITDLQIGDYVYTLNEKNKSIETKQIKNLLRKEFNGELIVIAVNNNIIKVTPDHKIFTANRGWIVAENITLSDIVLLI